VRPVHLSLKRVEVIFSDNWSVLMSKPNFLIIGAQRSGTTSLFKYLQQHPDIYMSQKKEPRFFVFDEENPQFAGSEKEKSEARYQALRQASVTNFQDYCDLFRNVTSQKAIGEASPHYLYCPRAAERIRYYLPDTKIIAILRDPVERAYSNFFLQGPTDAKQFIAKFTQAVRKEENNKLDDIWDGAIHYVRKGFYYSQLMRYYNIFDQNRIKVYLYDDLNENLTGLMQDIFRFLDVKDTFIPDTSMRFSDSARKVVGNTFLAKLLAKQWPKTLARHVFSNKYRHSIQQKLITYLDSTKKNFIKPALPPELRKQLIEIYREDTLKLQDLLQRDLSKWLQVEKN